MAILKVLFHSKDKVKYRELKDEYDAKIKELNCAQESKIKAESSVKKYEDIIGDMNCKIVAGNELIAKQQKKIFGKAKAKEIIIQTQKEIEEYQKTIAEANQNLSVAREQKDIAVKKYNEANSSMELAKNEYEKFLRKCGL